MRQKIISGSGWRFAFRLILFWLLIFLFARFIFLIVLMATQPSVPFQGWHRVFFYGLRLDLSAACYLSALPFLGWLISVHFRKAIWFIKGILLLEVAALAILLPVNIGIYQAWGTLLNRRAVTFIADPGAIIASLSFLQLTVGLIIIFLIAVLLWKGLKSCVFPFLNHVQNKSQKVLSR